ncbi:MAG: TatD family hydrolase, partial [Moraxellaceae bacterium]
MLTDIGLNLASHRFDADREAVLARARAAGVTRFILTGTRVADSTQALAHANAHDGCFATAGVHPHEARTLDAAGLATLRTLLAAPKVVAVGETGLDFNRNYSPQDAQEAAFVAQIGLAAETGLPLFLHERDAAPRFQAILRAHRNDWQDGVLHCFT